MGLSTTLAVPSPAHIDNKTPETSISPLVGRKQSFRGFSASSLSSLTLGRNQNKRNSIGTTRKSMNFLMSSFRDSEPASDSSRPPSLITDKSSLTSASSRSPSPEPFTSNSKLETAFKAYTSSGCPKLLHNVLLPSLSGAAEANVARRPSAGRKTSLTSSRTALTTLVDADQQESCLLEESDVNVLFKWWNHLLLLAAQNPTTFQSIYAIASHPTLRNCDLWSPHYELTLSTTLAQPATTLASTFFAKLIALGYIYHPSTSVLLRSLFTDPTKVSSVEPWVKRAKNVEVFIETSRQVFLLSPDFDDGGIIEARLEDMITKVIHVSSYPNPRLNNLCRLLSNSDGSFASLIELCLIRITRKIGLFDSVAAFYLLELLSCLKLANPAFWLEVLQLIISTENHVLQIRVFAFLYEKWSSFSALPAAVDLLLSAEQWQYFFSHWSGLVRDHFMRLIAYRVCLTHPHEVRDLLMRSFETSLLENCQLRDCLPGNPIPNKRFVIRPLLTRPSIRKPSRELKVGEAPVGLFSDESAATTSSPPEATTTVNFMKKKFGLLRGIWADETKEEALYNAPATSPPRSESTQNMNTSPPRIAGLTLDDTKAPTSQKFKFVPEYVGKQWSLTSDADAIRFLDSVMDQARDGRLPQHAYPLSDRTDHLNNDGSKPSMDLAERFISPFALGTGRKRLWTRSLSEWSTLLDDTDRFWRTCGGRSLSSPSAGGQIRRINCPKLEVDFPRWFVQRSTQIPGDVERL